MRITFAIGRRMVSESQFNALRIRARGIDKTSCVGKSPADPEDAKHGDAEEASLGPTI